MTKNKNLGGVRNSAPALSQKERGCPSGHITADKREIKDFPKLSSATSFIRGTLCAILLGASPLRIL